MTDFENEFEDFVKSVQFDDTPSRTHREQLEEQVLDVYDQRAAATPSPSGMFYLKRIAMAAGFVIAAYLLFLYFDDHGIAPNGHPAHAPDPQRVEQILQQEKVSGVQREALLSEIQAVWKLIAAEDVAALTEVVLDEQASRSVRLWAGETVITLGDEATLGRLEKTIEVQGLSDSDHPVLLTANRLRERLAEKPDPLEE